MKIALIANSSWNIVNFRMSLIRAIIATGYDLLVIAPEDKFSETIRNAGVKFISLKALNRKGTNPMKDLLLFFEFRSILKKEEVDLVLNYTIKPVIYGTLASRSLKIKNINTITGLGFSFLSKGLLSRLVLHLYRFSLNRADTVFFQNQDDRLLFLNLNLVDEDKTFIVPGSGINTKYFKSNRPTKADKNQVNFLFVGRLLYDKGIEDYVEAAKMLKPGNDCNFFVVGALDSQNPSGIKKKKLDSWVSGGIINYLGESDDIRSIIENSDVVVLPSYREGLPRVLLEAMALSKPIICTDTPGCRETVIEGENGYMVELKNPSALAQTMHRIIEDGYERRKSMGEQGRKLVIERFDEEIVINIYLEEIKKAFVHG